MIPAVLEYKDGERIVLNDNDGRPKMVPAFDPMLEQFVLQHEHDLPDQAVTHGQQIQIVACDQKTWEALDMVKTIQDELYRQTGEHFVERDEYREAAIQCYNDHGNPDLASGCRDYLSDEKMIGRWHYKDDDGHDITIPPKYRQYLCYLCPYQHAYVQVEIRRRRGMYSDAPSKRQVATAKRRQRHRK